MTNLSDAIDEARKATYERATEAHAADDVRAFMFYAGLWVMTLAEAETDEAERFVLVSQSMAILSGDEIEAEAAVFG